MTHLTLLVFIDAFRRDYVDRTTFIRSLVPRSRVASMREYFGFLPRAGYFGGLGPSATGFTNMYSCDPAASPFGMARGLPDSGTEQYFRETRAWIESQARTEVTPFARHYLSTAGIPLSLLPWFNLAETRAPWDREVGYRSIFHELEDRGDEFFYCAWPETNSLPDYSDTALVERTLDMVTPGHRLAYLHLGELDRTGHAHGPESAELQAALDITDALTERLVTTLTARFDRLDLLLFSDHGMVSVTGTVDVWSAIQSTGVAIGRDVVPFFDSTMARFWFPTNVARRAVAEALSTLPGRVLDDQDLERLDIAGCDPRNGELIFLAEPGHVIAPNFFQRENSCRGMHGCEPDCPDNMGIVLVHEHDRHDPVDLGVVGPTAIYTELRRLLGLGRPETVSVAHADENTRIEGCFTQDRDPRAHTMIRDHMSRIVAETLQLLPSAEAVILTGSFGRDEGGVRRDAEGRMSPVNDYDVLVLDEDTPAASIGAIEQLGHQLAAEFGTDFVHFSVWPSLDAAREPTLANFDLRHGHRVLWGDAHIIERLPRFAAAGIRAFEGLQLLYNRLGGLLTGFSWPATDWMTNDRRRGYLVNQIMKGRMALGDWLLIRAQAYDVSYQKRRERFTWLASGFFVPADRRDAILEAYDYKLHPDRVPVPDIAGAAAATLRWLVDAIVDATGQVSHRPARTPEDAAAIYSDLLGTAADIVETDNARAAAQLATNGVVQVKQTPTLRVRNAIYGAFPLVAAAADGDAESFARACDRLGACLTPPWPRALTPQNWEVVRARLSTAWLALI